MSIKRDSGVEAGAIVKENTIQKSIRKIKTERRIRSTGDLDLLRRRKWRDLRKRGNLIKKKWI